MVDVDELERLHGLSPPSHPRGALQGSHKVVSRKDGDAQLRYTVAPPPCPRPELVGEGRAVELWKVLDAFPSSPCSLMGQPPEEHHHMVYGPDVCG